MYCSQLTFHIRTSVLVRLCCALSIAVPVLYIAVFALRFAITLVLYYHGWLFETVGKSPSLPTKLFMVSVTLEGNILFFS